MSNIPENENINEIEEKFDISEGESTVFSNPVEHTRTAEKVKNKKLLPKILASVLSVAILAGGTFAVSKLIPEKEETSSEIMEDDRVLALTTDDLETVKVTNANGEFEFYREIVKDESTGEDIKGNWYLKGYDKDMLSTTTISYPISTAASFSASREITEKNVTECGLDKPSVTVDIKTIKGDEFSILIGAQSPDKSGYYVKLTNSDKIYLVDNEFYESFVFEALAFASTSALPTFEVDESMSNYIDENGNLISFDKITISGKNYPQKVELVVNKDEKFATYAPYLVTYPMERIAENADGILSLFQTEVSTEGAYSFDVSQSSLASFGLDDPDIILKIEAGGKARTYRFKLQDDGGYAVVYDNAKLISSVLSSNIAFADYTTTDFYSSWVALVSIEDISSFTFKAGEKEYKFGITANKSEEDSENENNSYTITYNGKNIPTDDFQTFYQDCVSIACTDYTVTQLSSSPEYSMTYEYKEGDNITVDFIKSGETRYQYRLNGKDMGKVNSSGIKKLFDGVKNLVNE